MTVPFTSVDAVRPQPAVIAEPAGSAPLRIRYSLSSKITSATPAKVSERVFAAIIKIAIT